MRGKKYNPSISLGLFALFLSFTERGDIMAVMTADEMRDYNIALFQKIKNDMLTVARYKRDYNIKEYCPDNCFGKYRLSFYGEHAWITVKVDSDIMVYVKSDTDSVKEKVSYCYFNHRLFMNDGKININLHTYRHKTARLFKYLFKEADMMPYDDTYRRHYWATYRLENESARRCFWEDRFLTTHSFYFLEELTKWLDCCTYYDLVDYEKEIVISAECLEMVCSEMVRRGKISQEAYDVLCRIMISDRHIWWSLF